MDKNIDPVVEQVMGDWLEVIESTGTMGTIPVWLRVARKVWGLTRWL